MQHLNPKIRHRAMLVAAIAILFFAVATAQARQGGPETAPATEARKTDSLVTQGLDENGAITIRVNKSRVLNTKTRNVTVGIGQPDTVTANVVSPTEIILTAKKPGATALLLRDENGRSETIDVVVTADLSLLQEQLKKMFPDSQIEARSMSGAIALTGRVPSLIVAQQAVEMAKAYAPSVLNFLEVSGGQQIMLQVRFAEVSRSATSNLGFNAFGTDGRFRGGVNNGPGGAPLGALATGAATAAVDPAANVFGAAQIGQTSLEFFIQALRRNNLLRVLAEPNLVAMSGEQASFLAGGEFPVPVPQSGGAGGGGTAITVEYKQFGIRLNFVPTVLGDGRIRLKVKPEVSDLDFTRSVSFNGFVIPSLTKRTLETTVELAEGQAFAVAGLLNTRVTANKDVTPLLGDIPILGALFRSVRYERNETELVVLVTPRLVEGMNPSQVPTLPGEHWRHPNEGELFLNTDLGGPAPDPKAKPTTRPIGSGGSTPPKYHGQYGFTPAK